MKVLISGSNGFVGSELKKFLIKNGFAIDILQRKEYANPIIKIESADVIINLAGAPILKRWSQKNKKIIHNSRIDTTKSIVDAIIKAKNKPKLFISTSATGIYSNHKVHDEYSKDYNNDFLSQVCSDWEAEALNAQEITRVVIFRLGIVLGNNGGAFPKMSKPFKFGFGGKIGNGSQAMPWIHIFDLLNAYKFIIQNKELKGVFNLTVPDMIDNKVFTKTLSQLYGKPAIFTIPSFLLKLFYGEASQVLISGQKVYPKRLIDSSFALKFPKLTDALTNILNSDD